MRISGTPRHAISEKILTDSFQVLGCFGVMTYGAILLISRQAPASLLVFAPTWAIISWGIVLTLSGAAVLVGMFKSLPLEAFGLVSVAGATLAYGVALPIHYGIGGLAAMAFAASFGAAAAIRAYSIIVARRITEAVLRDSN